MICEIKTGDVCDFRNYVNAVIDNSAFDKIMSYLDKVKLSDDAKILAGGNGDKSKGYFIQPTVIVTENPHFFTMEEEIFGPLMTIYIYKDDKFDETLSLCDETSPYAVSYTHLRAHETDSYLVC